MNLMSKKVLKLTLQREKARGCQKGASHFSEFFKNNK